MLRASLLADVKILPQARQGSYFFNRIGPKLTPQDFVLSDPIREFAHH
jgi:hypothetical protein